MRCDWASPFSSSDFHESLVDVFVHFVAERGAKCFCHVEFYPSDFHESLVEMFVQVEEVSSQEPPLRS